MDPGAVLGNALSWDKLGIVSKASLHDATTYSHPLVSHKFGMVRKQECVVFAVWGRGEQSDVWVRT